MSSNLESRHELRLDLPAAHRGVRVARNVLRHFARLLGEKDQEVETLTLVVSELLANVIDHGGGRAAMTEAELPSDVRMQLIIVFDTSGWTLTVTDQGGGDPDEIRRLISQATDQDLESERGRGLYLLRELVDEVAVAKNVDGRGLTIRATKRHDAS